jgi:predicted anti-sigma-YlaC factor YlaD
MECAEVRDRLPELLTERGAEPRELTGERGAEPRELAAHLVRCEPCRREVESVRRVLDLVQRATEVHADEAAPPFEQVLARVRSRRRVRPRLLLARAAALIVASLAGAAVDHALLQAGRATPPDDRRPGLDARADARRALAERPGGLGASLAVLRALAADHPRH